MRKVVVNSTPLIILCGIGRLDILRMLYQEITTPMAVFREVTAKEEYQKFIDQMIKDSDVDTGVKPQTSNKILTFSTCTGNGYRKRLAIHAVCVDAQTTDESKLKETGN